MTMSAVLARVPCRPPTRPRPTCTCRTAVHPLCDMQLGPAPGLRMVYAKHCSARCAQVASRARCCSNGNRHGGPAPSSLAAYGAGPQSVQRHAPAILIVMSSRTSWCHWVSRIHAENDGLMIFEALPATREFGPNLGFRGAPLRNRTVDLLLTIRNAGVQCRYLPGKVGPWCF
jgi:hypothetical protein